MELKKLLLSSSTSDAKPEVAWQSDNNCSLLLGACRVSGSVLDVRDRVVSKAYPWGAHIIALHPCNTLCGQYCYPRVIGEETEAQRDEGVK